MNAISTPIMTVHPISVPCVSIPQKIAGWNNKSNGLIRIFQNVSSVFLPLKGRSDFKKGSFRGGSCTSSPYFSLSLLLAVEAVEAKSSLELVSKFRYAGLR